MSVGLFNEYMQLVNPATGRARPVSMVESANPSKMCQLDVEEAQGIAQFSLSGVQLAAKSLIKDDLEKFDAVTGDHNCHVEAVIALEAFQDAEIQNEARRLLEFVEQKKGKYNIRIHAPKAPHIILSEEGYAIELSSRMKYLVIAAILRSGTECVEHREGGFTIKVSPQKMRDRLAKKCPIELIKRLIVPFREYLNRCSIEKVMRLGKEFLPEPKAHCLTDAFIKVATTPRGEQFQYACAVLNMQACLTAMARRGVHFAVVEYHPERKPESCPLIFSPESMRLVDPKTLDPKTALFVIQVFGERAQLEEYGLMKFILASAALNPQFVDMEEAAFANDEDLKELPQHMKEEIGFFRNEGRAHTIPCRICHTYADILENLTRGAS